MGGGGGKGAHAQVVFLIGVEERKRGVHTRQLVKEDTTAYALRQEEVSNRQQR